MTSLLNSPSGFGGFISSLCLDEVAQAGVTAHPELSTLFRCRAVAHLSAKGRCQAVCVLAFGSVDSEDVWCTANTNHLHPAQNSGLQYRQNRFLTQAV